MTARWARVLRPARGTYVVSLTPVAPWRRPPWRLIVVAMLMGRCLGTAAERAWCGQLVAPETVEQRVRIGMTVLDVQQALDFDRATLGHMTEPASLWVPRGRTLVADIVVKQAYRFTLDESDRVRDAALYSTDTCRPVRILRLGGRARL